ncbi:MAG: hypothetical protein ACOYNL_03385 [Rickettsiales bacterium]
MKFTIDIPDDRVGDLKTLATRCGLKSLEGLVEYALGILKWGIETVESGKEVASIDRDTGQWSPASHPALDYAASKANPATFTQRLLQDAIDKSRGGGMTP